MAFKRTLSCKGEDLEQGLVSQHQREAQWKGVVELA